jgi:uncharacterized protein YndB with AHSA1/START domain
VGAPRSIDHNRHAQAPVETVWEIVSNHRAYPQWTTLRTARLEREGTDHPDGVGAVRFLGVGPIGAREEVLEFEPPRHLAYTILSGPPARDYRADVCLEETSDGGTDLRWTGSFRSAPFGAAHLTRVLLVRALRTLADGVVVEAERRAGLARAGYSGATSKRSA